MNYTKGVSSRDTFHKFKKIGFILKVSLQETLSTISWKISNFEETPSTIPKKWNYTKVVSWRDTFHNFKKIWVYAKQFLYTVENFKFMLKVSLQETSLVLKTFAQFLIHIKFYGIVESVFARDTFSINPVFKNCRKCLLKRHF